MNPAAESQVHQGVTLDVVGQYGHSCAPVDDPEVCRQSILGYHPGVEITWRSFDEYLSRLEKLNLGLNVMAMVGHGTVYRTVMKGQSGTPTPDDVKQMQSLVEASLELSFKFNCSHKRSILSYQFVLIFIHLIKFRARFFTTSTLFPTAAKLVILDSEIACVCALSITDFLSSV